MSDTPIFSENRGAHRRSSTLFERMHRANSAPPTGPSFADPVAADRPHFANGQHLLVVDQPTSDATGDVRFERSDVDGLPGIVMQQRQDDDTWLELWSLPTQSLDAREGMFGWLTTQSPRWDRFAKMLQRRGADELTNWIFELMVQPNVAAARPPRLQPQAWVTIDQYESPRAEPTFRQSNSVRIDNCVCRHNPRDF